MIAIASFGALLPVGDTAQYLGVGTTKLGELRDGKVAGAPPFPLPTYLDSDPRWKRADLDEWVAQLATHAVKPDRSTSSTPVRHRRSKHDDLDQEPVS